MVGLYLGVFTLIGLSSNAVLGRLAPRIGNQRIMLGAGIAGLLMALLVAALLAYDAAVGGVGPGVADWWLVPVFVFSAVREACMGVAGTPLLFDVAHGKDQTLYLGFTNSVQGIGLLATGLGGVVVEGFGFATLLGLTVAAYAVAIWAARRLAATLAHDTAVKPV
jgi:MFS family permease